MRLFLLFVMFVLFDAPVFSASLVGSKESLKKQNEVADREGLVRIKTMAELRRMVEVKRLVPIPQSMKVDPKLDRARQFGLPRVADFLDVFGVDFIDAFGKLLQVNSAVRPIEFQNFLILSKKLNAAPVSGDRASSHLTGATIDIEKRGLSKDELLWVRGKLLHLEDLDLLEATEENYEPVFHIMVFASYSDYVKVAKRP